MKNVALLLGCWFAGSANATAILHYVDSDSGLFGAALTELGLTATTTSHADFLTDLSSQTWDLIVVDTPGRNVSSANTAALDDYLDAGGASIISHWHYDANPALAAAYDVAVMSTFYAPTDVHVWDPAHPIFAGVTGIFDYDRDAGDNGDRFSAINGAIALAGFTPVPTATDAAIVLGNDGHSIINGWLFWDAQLTTNNIRLVANQVDYLLSRPASSVPEPASVALFALGLAGLGLARSKRNA